MSGPSVGSLLVTCLLFAAAELRSVGEPPWGCPASAAAAPAAPASAAAAAAAAAPAQAPAHMDGSRVFSAYFRKLTRQRRAIAGSPERGSAPRGPVERLSPHELFIAVKSTRRYHEQRLGLLLDTWISRNMQQTYVFTDGEDDTLRKRLGAHLINTNCSATHSRQALSCKMAQEYDAFIRSGKKWFCHVDDDNYLNAGALLKLLSHYSHTQDVYLGRPSLERPIQAAEQISTGQMRQVSFWFATGGAGFCLSQGLALKMKPWARTFVETAEHISLPDDCTIGYIVEALLGVSLTRSPLFHSHLENLDLVSDVHNQVTLSYGTAETQRNTVNIRGAFSTHEDPTRFRSVHCLLYPDTTWCLGSQQV